MGGVFCTTPVTTTSGDEDDVRHHDLYIMTSTCFVLCVLCLLLTSLHPFDIYVIFLMCMPLSISGNSADKMKINSVKISPDPPVKGKNVTIDVQYTLGMTTLQLHACHDRIALHQ